jgi:hypothetical protein
MTIPIRPDQDRVVEVTRWIRRSAAVTADAAGITIPMTIIPTVAVVDIPTTMIPMNVRVRARTDDKVLLRWIPMSSARSPAWEGARVMAEEVETTTMTTLPAAAPDAATMMITRTDDIQAPDPERAAADSLRWIRKNNVR